MPLEPHRSEACRSCQPMHVLSFGEGRKCCLLLSFSDFRYERLVYETLHPVDFDTSLVIMDILCASERGNAPDFIDGDSMIVCLFLYHAFAKPFHRIVSILTSKG